MINHLHLVLCVDIYQANQWSDIEVLEHWHQVFKGTELTQQFVQGHVVEAHDVANLKHHIAIREGEDIG